MLWKPYTQMKGNKELTTVISAKGTKLYTTDGVLIDSISSWWTNIHGYNNEELNQAVSSQMEDFAHIMLGSLGLEPANKFAEELKNFLPGTLDYVFFSDSGSVAVEVSLKMAIQYFANQGKNKYKIASLIHGYHGDTFKAMQIGDDIDYHSAFGHLDTSDIFHVAPDIDQIEELFKKEADNIAAFILEPLVQCAGGFVFHEVDFLQELRQLCDKYDVLLIFDEVVTAFGRFGYNSISELVEPDIVVLGKAMTGGYIGHAATVANKRVWDMFYSEDKSKGFMHGPTYMGNALACAAGMKSLEIYRREDYLSMVKEIEKVINENIFKIKSEKIKDIRVKGACGVIEVHDSADVKGLSEFAKERGVFIRPFETYAYLMPPYIITEEEIIKIIDTLEEWFNASK